MSQVVGSAAAKSPSKGGALSQAAGTAAMPVPESSPPSPESQKGSEVNVAEFMARLAALEQALAESQKYNRQQDVALEKEKKDNARLERSLRAAIAATQQEEEDWQEGAWQDEEERQDEPAAKQGGRRNEDTEVPEKEMQEMPLTYLMTPQRPPGNLDEYHWHDDERPTPNQWNQGGWSGNLFDPLPQEGTWHWATTAAAKNPTADEGRWCQPAWSTTWQSPQQCDPWAEYSRGQQAWSSGKGGDWHGQWNGEWGNQWCQPLRQPDRKDVDRPSKYTGDITQWLQWSKAFARFLRRQDWRWS